MALISAMFIDFDNIHSTLNKDDPAIAARFVGKPLAWLTALQTEFPLPAGSSEDCRRIVSRRCYASPDRINHVRRNFTQSGFEVIDCPPLTTQLKNSADIYVVMDIIDYLARYPRIEEFIILSADADFLPVLNRLRKEMKFSTIFTAANTSSAYRNCADRTIGTDFFTAHLTRYTPALRELVRAAIDAAVRQRGGRLPVAAAASIIKDAAGARLGSDYIGYDTFKALLTATDLPDLEVDWKASEIRSAVQLSAATAAEAEGKTAPGAAAPGAVPVPLAAWTATAEPALVEFILHVAESTQRKIPLWSPATFTCVFDGFVEYYRGEPKSYSEAIKAVVAGCDSRGIAVTASEVRFVGTGINIQGYSFDADAAPETLAALWRVNVFDLCEQPEWMRAPDNAAQLVAWCHAEPETIDRARDDFIERTAPPVAEVESGAV